MNNQNQQLTPSQSQNLILPDISDLLKRTWQAYKARLKVFLGIMLLPVIVGFLAIFLERFLKVSVTSPFYFLYSIILLILILIFHFWSQVSLLFAIKERKEEIGIAESFRKGWHKIFALIWISILVGFIVIGGFGLFIIPGIIFSVWFALAPYVLVSEDKKGMESLLRSKNLVSGHWWEVFWRFLTIDVILFVITLFARIVTILNIPFIENVVNLTLPLFLTPFATTFYFLVYEDLRCLKKEVPLEKPKRKTKIKYILIGIAGFLLIFGLVLSIIMPSLQRAKKRARDVKVVADMIQIRAMAEMIYMESEDYSKVSCLHPKLTFLCKDIEDLTGEKPIIHASQNAYCIYTKLMDKKYYCIDSRGGAEKTDIFPGKKGYCDGRTFICPPQPKQLLPKEKSLLYLQKQRL